MPEKLKRPAPFTPLSVTFATGQTGTAILDHYGLDGLAVWAAMLAAAKHEEGLIVFRHDNDWGAIGLAGYAPENFALGEFLTFLGRRKQTRTTRSGRVVYVELTRWGEWNQTKERAESRWRKARSRRNSDRDNSVTPAGQERDPAVTRARATEPEIEVELETTPQPPSIDEPEPILEPRLRDL